jgi:hypothetical protein
MNPKLLFWVPALLRLSLVFAAAGVAWWLFGLVPALALALAAVVTALFVQLAYLHELGEWLHDPSSGKLPDGWGAWTDVFARLYRLRRDDERNQAELTGRAPPRAHARARQGPPRNQPGAPARVHRLHHPRPLRAAADALVQGPQARVPDHPV